MTKEERRSKKVLRTKFPLALIFTPLLKGMEDLVKLRINFLHYLLHPVMTFSRAL